MTNEPNAYVSGAAMDPIRQEALEFAGVGLYRYALDGTIVFMDRAALRIFDLEEHFPDPSQVTGRNVSELVVYARPQGVLREETRKTGQVLGFEAPFKTLKGKAKWASHDCRLIREPETGEETIQVVIRDITDRKQAERLTGILLDLSLALGATSDLKEAMDLILDAALELDDVDNGGLFLVDEETGGLELAIHRGVSPEFIRRFTRIRADAPETKLVMSGQPVYRSFGKLLSWTDAVIEKEGLRAFAVIPFQSGGKVVGALNIGSHTSDAIPVHSRNVLESIAAQIGGLLARIRTEEALRESEEQYRALLDNLEVGIALIGPDRRIIVCNAAQGRIYRKDPDQFVGKLCFEEFEKRETVCPHCPGAVSMLTRQPADIETVGVRDDGSRFPVHLRSFPVFGPDGVPKGFVQMVEDITARKRAESERRKLEAQVQHTQKLESLGVLAGGIAHDFNNLLMGVLGHADLALMDMAPAAPARPHVEEVEKAALRAADLCKQMLAYSGKGRFVIQPLDLSEVVREMAHLLEISISKKTTLKYDFGEDLPAVEADATQLRQVIMNLITNASEAIGDDNGVVSVRTGFMACDHAYLAQTYLDENLPEGEYVYIEVSDTGCGMDPDTRTRIFDPFFTTKFAGRGLGLAAVLGIVRGHRGAIRVYSEPQQGTTFKVLFPASEQPVEAQGGGPLAGDESSGVRTILVVDDELTVRSLAQTMLERARFKVLTAGDGREGVEVFKAHAEDIDAVVLDMTMPHLNGEEAFRELRRISPAVPVILSSGYNEQEALDRFAGKGLAGFIQKPYQSKALLTKVREVLEV